MTNLIFYTDGACHFNPGPGGFGVIALSENNILQYKYAEYFNNTTNNQMELKAILHVLKLAAAHEEKNFIIYSDSAYAVNCLIDWCPVWAKNNWIRKGNKPILNLELIQEMYFIYLQIKNRITIIKVKGHKGILGNELADKLATKDEKGFNNLLKQYQIEKEEIL